MNRTSIAAQTFSMMYSTSMHSAGISSLREYWDGLTHLQMHVVRVDVHGMGSVSRYTVYLHDYASVKAIEPDNTPAAD